jgi:hypothetical protein
VHAALYTPFERVLSDGIASDELRPVEVSTTATAIVGSASMVGLQVLVTSGHLDADALSEQLVEVFWSGLCASSASPPAPRARR